MKNENTDTMMNRMGFRLDPPSEVLSPESFSSPEFFTQCCVCKKVRIGDEWVGNDVIDQAAAACSHGYCPDCFRQVLQHIDMVAEGSPGVAHVDE